MKRMFLILFLSFSILPVAADSCKINWCNSSKLTMIEKRICSDPALRASEVLLSQLYKEIMSYRGKEGHEGHWPDSLRDAQKRWLKKRNQLLERSALLNIYMLRIQRLHQFLSEHTGRNI